MPQLEDPDMTTRVTRFAALRRLAFDFIVPAALAVAAITASPSASAHAWPRYVTVPPHHARHWHYYCHRWHACDQRVYFVRGSWVFQRHEMPHMHRHDHGYDHRHHRGHDHRWYGYRPAPPYWAQY